MKLNADIKLIEIEANLLEKICAIIRRDAIFLNKHNLMDYSLLLVIETVKKDSDFSKSLVSEDGRNQIKHEDKVYHIGIIDYLQAWNMSKKIENKYKGSNPDISAVPPYPYYHHFLRYAQNHIFKTGHSEHESTLNW